MGFGTLWPANGGRTRRFTAVTALMSPAIPDAAFVWPTRDLKDVIPIERGAASPSAASASWIPSSSARSPATVAVPCPSTNAISCELYPARS
jgi:hypothetical protein